MGMTEIQKFQLLQQLALKKFENMLEKAASIGKYNDEKEKKNYHS